MCFKVSLYDSQVMIFHIFILEVLRFSVCSQYKSHLVFIYF